MSGQSISMGLISGTMRLKINQVATYALPQSRRILSYVPEFWRMFPTSQEKPTETIEENIPPMPTTEATARFGKMSETTVNMVADQPWLAAPASAKKLA